MTLATHLARAAAVLWPPAVGDPTDLLTSKWTIVPRGSGRQLFLTYEAGSPLASRWESRFEPAVAGSVHTATSTQG